MLYSTTIKFDKEYIIKMGLKEVTEIENLNIDIFGGAGKVLDVVKILTVCLKRNKDLFIKEDGKQMSFEESMDKVMYLYDESNISLTELKDVINKAISLGILKKLPNTEKEAKEKNSKN